MAGNEVRSSCGWFVGRPRVCQRVLRVEGFESGEIFKMIRARLALPLALGALGSCCALGDEVVLLPAKDNTIYSNDALFGNATSDGGGPHMYVGQTSFSGARRALIQFDVSSVPADADIDGVTLSF